MPEKTLQEMMEDTNKVMHDLKEAIAKSDDSKLDEAKIDRMVAAAMQKAEAERVKAAEEKQNAQKAKDAAVEEQLRALRAANPHNWMFPVLEGHDDVAKGLKDLSEKAIDLKLLSLICKKPFNELKMYKDIVGSQGDVIIRKAMDTAQTSNGAEFIATGFSSQVFEYVTGASPILANSYVFTLPQNPYKFPVGINNAVAYHAGEATGDAATAYTASDVGTSDVTWDAEKLAVLVYSSDELDEDSIVPMLPYITNSLRTRMIETIEKAIMRGDTATGSAANINRTSGACTAGMYWLSMNGIAKQCIDGSGGLSFDIATLYADDILTSAGLLGKYAAAPMMAPILCDRATFHAMLGMGANSGSTTPIVATREKYGDAAPILTGELARVYGFPILPTDNYVLTTDTASGEIANLESAQGTKGGFMQYFRNGLCVGFKRQITVESERNIKNGQHCIVATARLDVQFPYGPASCVLGYDRD